MQRRRHHDPEWAAEIEALANQCLKKLCSIDKEDWSPNSASSAQINGTVIDSLCNLLTGLGFEDVVKKVGEVREQHP